MPTLEATKRDVKGRKNYAVRMEGNVPAVVYGFIDAPETVTVSRNEFVRLYKEAGESTVIDLTVDGKTHHVLIHDFQLDPIRDEVIHIDFRAIDMTKEIEAEVRIHFVDESPAVKALNGTLVVALDHVNVRCLPKDLPASLPASLSLLKTFDDAIHVKDLIVPQGVEVEENPEQTIAVVSAPRTDAEMQALDEAVDVDVSAVEVEGEKKEGEEGAEEAGGAEEKKEE